MKRLWTRLTVGAATMIAMVASSSVLAEPAVAADSNCSGKTVRICFQWVVVDGKLQGNAHIRDITDSGAYWVALQDVSLAVRNGATVANVTDFDGWHRTADTPAYLPGTRTCGSYVTRATFKWKYGSTGAVKTKRVTSPGIAFCQ